VLPEHLGDLTAEGIYQQVVWHEIGHYLGPDTDRRGRSLDAALEADAAPIEELKAELVSQFAMTRLLALGLVDEAAVRGVAASVILASLRPVRPLRSQAYSTIWLMVLNYYLDRGYLVYDAGRIGIRQERHEAAVSAMLADVLAIQEEGSKERSTAYIDRWTAWDDRHEAIARALRGAERYRYLDARYGLLDAAGAGEAPMGASSSR
jgi:antirestriction protein ArdC